MDILVILLVVLICMILMACIVSDIRKSENYIRATKAEGMICENRGEELISFYGRHQYRKYVRYLVSFNTPRGVLSQEVLLKDRKLQNGARTQVRYIAEHGNLQLVDDISYRKIKELIIVTLIVVPLCIIGMYLSQKGII